MVGEAQAVGWREECQRRRGFFAFGMTVFASMKSSSAFIVIRVPRFEPTEKAFTLLLRIISSSTTRRMGRIVAASLTVMTRMATMMAEVNNEGCGVAMERRSRKECHKRWRKNSV